MPDFNLEHEYGYFLDRLVHHLDEQDTVEHYGVKGMKWGVRKQRDPSKEIQGLGPNAIIAKTKHGETITLSKNRPNAIIRFIARHNTKFREDANNFAALTIRDSTGKKVGDAQLAKVNADEINLIWLGVKTSERGKGYATAAMSAAVDFGKQAGVKKLTLEVPGNSPDARHIYEKQGFKVTHEEIDPNDDVWGGLTNMEYNFDQVRHSMTLEQDKPPLDEDILIHFGVKGMKWGRRKTDHPGASRATNKEARKDATEFARAKLFYGEGAGNRRKLIKATVEAKSKRDPAYKAAFEHHLAQQDLAQHAQKARGERKRKDTKATVGKNARAVNRAINGPFAGPVIATTVLGAYGYAKSTGLDKKVMNAGRAFMNQARTGTKVDLSFLNR